VGLPALSLDPRCQNHDSPAEECAGYAYYENRAKVVEHVMAIISGRSLLAWMAALRRAPPMLARPSRGWNVVSCLRRGYCPDPVDASVIDLTALPPPKRRRDTRR
jgi:hypothetical protein